MTDEQQPPPTDNSTLLFRFQELRQHFADLSVPDEVRELLECMIDEAITAIQRLDPATMQLLTDGRAIDAYDDLKDIVEQLLSAIKRMERWSSAWIDRTQR